MDKSEIYIRMADCEEIQEQWNPKSGDLFFDPSIHKSAKIIHKHIPDLSFDLTAKAYGFVSEGTFICDGCSLEHDMYTFNKFYPRDEVVWLPYQHQIQEMIFDENHPFSDIQNQLAELIHKLNEMDADEHYTWQFKTWEQLWLAFMMWQKYQKMWDGEKWVKTRGTN